MKKLFIIFSLFFSVAIFSQSKKYFCINSDEIILYYFPPIKKLNQFKEQISQEDFYISIDDEQYYYSNTINYLDKRKIKYFTTKKDLIYIVIEKKIIKIPKKIEMGGFFIYKNGKFNHFINSVDMIDWLEENEY
jgi:hypothetical protein